MTQVWLTATELEKLLSNNPNWGEHLTKKLEKAHQKALANDPQPGAKKREKEQANTQTSAQETQPTPEPALNPERPAFNPRKHKDAKNISV